MLLLLLCKQNVCMTRKEYRKFDGGKNVKKAQRG
jgi:hypothetical protein